MESYVPNTAQTLNMSRFSCKLRITKYLRSDNTHKIELQVFVQGQRIRIHTGIGVKKEQWSERGRMIKPNHPDHADLNNHLQSLYSRANNINLEYRLRNQTLTPERFKEEYFHGSTRVDFLVFWNRELMRRQDHVEKATIEHHRVAMNKLKEFRSQIPFSQLTPELLHDYAAWLKKVKKNGPTTVQSAMKNIRTYVNIALKQGIDFKNPFSHYKVGKMKGHRTALSKEEVTKMLDLYKAPYTSDRMKNTLQVFLFSCFTGLRVSDLYRFERSWICGDVIRFKPKKTENYNKTVEVPLTAIAKSLINKRGPVFNNLTSEQKVNKCLKEIAKFLGIKKKVSFHVGRHTFATLFLEAGGSVEVLKDILGHTDISTTIIYVHIAQHRKAVQAGAMDQLFSSEMIA